MRLSRAVTAAAIALALVSHARSEDAPADPRAVFQASVEKLVELAPELRSVDVAGFAGRGGHSLCGTALTEALLVALDEEARNPNRALRERPLSVRRAGSGVQRPEGPSATAIGALDVDQQGRAFVALSFRQGDAVLAPTGRVAVALDRLSCDPAMRPFLEHVAAGARTDRERLDLSASAFSRGERLEIAITAKRPLLLYCWVLAEDGSGFVTLPAGGGRTEVAAGLHRYPRAFRLEEVVLTQRFENLFACFGAEEALPEALEAQWRRFAPQAGKDTPLIDAETLRGMMDEMRATPDVSEAVARVTVR